MAAVTFAIGLQSTANTGTYTTSSFTPAANDLIVVFVHASGCLDNQASLTDSLGNTYDLVATTGSRSTADTTYVFICTSLAAATARTVTFDGTGDTGTGADIDVYRVSGMTNTGKDALRQWTAVGNKAAGNTPALTFHNNALTGNPTFGCVSNATNPAGLTPPTSWTEGNDSGYSTPATGMETVYRDSGFTGTTITWGSTSASQFGAIIIELQTNAAPTVALNSPADGGSTSDTTPDLTFTGSDSDSDDLTYALELDTVNTFDSGGTDTPAWVQDIFDTSGGTSKSFSTLPTVGNVLVYIHVVSNVNDVSPPTDNQGNTYVLRAKVREVTGSNYIHIFTAEVKTSSGTFTVNYPANGSVYVGEYSGVDVNEIVAYADGKGNVGGAANNLTVNVATANSIIVGVGYDEGSTAQTAGSGFTLRENQADNVSHERAMFQDGVFATTGNKTFTWGNCTNPWVAAAIVFKPKRHPSVLKLSASDSGFVDVTNGADTDPFAAGNQITHTIQTALSSGTYYWRVKAKDSGGTNKFGAWATVRSIIISGATNWSKSLSDSFTLSEARVSKPVANKSDTTTLSETRVSKPTLNKSDSFTLSDVFSRIAAFIRSLSDSFTLSEAISKRPTLNKADSLTLSEANAKSAGLNKADSITLTDNETATTGFNRSLSDNTTLTDSRSNKPTANKADSLTLSEANTKAVGKNLADIITLSDLFARTAAYIRSLSDSLTLSDQITKKPALNKADSLTLSEANAKTVGKAANDSLSLTDAKSNRPTANKADNLSLSEASHRAVTLNKSDSLTLTDSFAKTIGKVVADTISLIETTAKAVGLNKADATTLTDNSSVSGGIAYLLSDSVSLGDSSYRAAVLGKADSISLADNMSHVSGYGRQFDETIGLNDALAKSVRLNKADSLALSELVSKAVSLLEQDTIGATDLTAKDFELVLADLIRLGDTFTFGSLVLSLHDTIHLSERILLNPTLPKFGLIADVDTGTAVIAAEDGRVGIVTPDGSVVVQTEDGKPAIQTNSGSVNIGVEAN